MEAKLTADTLTANTRPGRSAPARARIRRVARRLVIRKVRERQGEIEGAIWEGVNDRRFDLTGSEDPEYMAGLRAAAVAALEHVLSDIERPGRGYQGQRSPEPAPAAAIEQARRAARMGVKLDTVLRRYAAGQALLGRFIAREVERDERLAQAAVLSDVLGAVAERTDRLMAAVSDAYRAQVEEADRPLDSARVHGQGAAPATEVQVRTPAPTATPGVPEMPGSSERSARSGPPAWTGPVSAGSPGGLQRARILGAIVEVVAERGCAGASVGTVVERARVARRTFYDQFPGGLDEGLIAVMDETLMQAASLAIEQLERCETWQEGLRAATAAVLVFFDAEPQLARVCLVSTLGASSAVVEHRERVVRAFRAQIAARIESEGVHVPPVTAESVLASIMGMVRARLVERRHQQLIELLGPLLEAVAIPLAASEQTVREERRRGDELARAIQVGEAEWVLPSGARAGAQSGAGEAEEAGGDGGEDALPAILTNPNARRLRECLQYTAEHPGLSNREVAAGIGVTHSSQISKLLSELLDAGLASRRSQGAGKRNVWRLTEQGLRAAQALSVRDIRGCDIPSFGLTES